MNALNNANIADYYCMGLASFAFPTVKSTKGESVEYAFDVNKSWYILRIKYEKAQKISDFLIGCGTYSYLAMVWKDIYRNGKRRRVKKPFMNLLFAYMTGAEADYYVKESAESPFITYYYDHFTTDAFGKNPPLIVEGKDLKNLIIATSLDDEHVMEVDMDNCRFDSDDFVLVTDGPFKGVCGRVARIARQKRVVITIKSLGIGITTAYIPPYCLKKIAEDEACSLN